MSVSRATLIGGPGRVTWNGVSMFARDDIQCSFDATWQDLIASHQGIIDKVVTDRMVKVNLKLWGAWESLSVLFPTAALNPVVGTRIFGTSDLPLVLIKKTGAAETITVVNAQLTKLANLYLGVDQDMFAADVEFTGLIKNSGNPEDASAYYTIGSGGAADALFAKTNFSRQRYSAAWGASPFAAFQAHKGWNIEWDYKLEPEYNANVGTVDFIQTGFNAKATCIPLGPTIAEIDARMLFQGAGNPLGGLLSDGAGTDNLVITGTTPSAVITLKLPAITGWKPVLGATPLLNGIVTWETTRGFASGVGAALATAA